MIYLELMPLAARVCECVGSYVQMCVVSVLYMCMCIVLYMHA